MKRKTAKAIVSWFQNTLVDVRTIAKYFGITGKAEIKRLEVTASKIRAREYGI